MGTINRTRAMTDHTITVRYAETDGDVVAIHGFLCIVAGPTLPGAIDPKDSATGVWMTATYDVALMAIKDDRLIGVLGLCHNAFWWNNKIKFLANRIFFTLPGSGAGSPLLREGIAIAKASNLELHIYDERKGRLVIFNRHPSRSDQNPLLAN